MKTKYEKEEDIPAEHRSKYIQGIDGSWYLIKTDEPDASDDAPLALKQKVDEFRDTNRRLMRERAEMEAKLKQFDGIDPALVAKQKEAIAKVQQQEERDLLQAGRFDDVVTRRTAAMRDAHAAEMRAMKEAMESANKQATQFREQLGVVQIDQRVQDAIGKLGLRPRPNAAFHLQARSRATWRIDESGQPIAVDGSGEKLYGKDGTPLSFSEFAAKLAVEDAFLFESPAGGGAPGGGKGGPAVGPKMVANTPENISKYAQEIAAGKVKVDMGGD